MKIEENNDSEASENEEQYTKLANDISQLDSTQRVKAPTRKELSSIVSEFHLPKVDASSNDVTVTELIKVLRGKPLHDKISNKVKSVTKKAKTLPKPLEKPVADKIKRSLGYENVVKQLNKWRGVVARNRTADQLKFPLQQERFSLEPSHRFLDKFKDETPLEIEMSKILKGEQKEELKEMEEELGETIEFPLTLEELMQKRKEMAQLRAKISYREAKAHRQSKIKSKKYHRILKREKIKQQLKDFEQLQKTDPEAALKKLEILDRARAQERASLRHKNTGKWAKNMAVRAKYDKETRKVLAEQLKLSRDLTEKVKHIGSDDDMSDIGENGMAQTSPDIPNDNPWALDISSEVTNFISGYKKYWENKNATNKQSETSTNSISNEKTSPTIEKSWTTNQRTDLNCNGNNQVAASLNRISENSESTGHSRSVGSPVGTVRNLNVNGEAVEREEIKEKAGNSETAVSENLLNDKIPSPVNVGGKSITTKNMTSEKKKSSTKELREGKSAAESEKVVKQKQTSISGCEREKVTEYKKKTSDVKKTSDEPEKSVKKTTFHDSSINIERKHRTKKKKKLDSSDEQTVNITSQGPPIKESKRKKKKKLESSVEEPKKTILQGSSVKELKMKKKKKSDSSEEETKKTASSKDSTIKEPKQETGRKRNLVPTEEEIKKTKSSKDSLIKEAKQKKNKKSKKIKTAVYSTSGLWTVIPLDDDVEPQRKKKKKERKKEEEEEKEKKEKEEKGKEREKEKEKKKEKSIKRKSTVDVDDLFDELDEKLAEKTAKKLRIIKEKFSAKKKKARRKKEKKRDEEEYDGEKEEELEAVTSLSGNKNSASLRPDMDVELLETAGKEAAPSDDVPIPVAVSSVAAEESIPSAEIPLEIDPKNFVEVKVKNLNTKLPYNVGADPNDYIDDEENEQRMNIMEAFDGDDVMEEFEEMKKQEEESTKLEVPDSLPGWGSWGGTGIKPVNRKVKRFIDVTKLPPRKDKDRKDLIINEKANAKLISHMVKLVPHPFKSVGAFEANVRHPVGREWVPETAHRELIKKSVETRLGTVIEPMDESELLHFKKKTKSFYRGKVKDKAN